jgi:hypothetical protein
MGGKLDLVGKTTIRSPATVFGRELEPLDAKIGPLTRLNYGENKKLKKDYENKKL